MHASRVLEGGGNNQLLYFTGPSFTADDNNIIFISDRTGHPNIFKRDFTTGEEKQLTHNVKGFLKSASCFDGLVEEGFGKDSVTVHPESEMIYYILGRKICCVDLQGNHRILAEYPRNQVTAFTTVSHDGSRLCLPSTDARALEFDPDFIEREQPVEERVRSENLSSYLRIYDTDSGEELAVEEVPGAWVTHPQYSPSNRNVILYNHEWPHDCGIQRMWLWDGGRHIRLRGLGGGRSRGDWVCHEVWERDGRTIIYHGKYVDGSPFIGRVNSDGGGLIEIPLDRGLVKYGHPSTGNRGLVVFDGYRQPPGLSSSLMNTLKSVLGNRGGKSRHSGWYGEWICILKINWEKRRVEYRPLCRHRSNITCQDDHPHPVFNHKSNAVYFNSKTRGLRSIYKVSIPENLK
jgi:oligogalacturonide lyase